MRRVCAWCEKEMGETTDGGEMVTHGICAECAEAEMRRLAGRHAPELEKALDDLLRVVAEGTSWERPQVERVLAAALSTEAARGLIEEWMLSMAERAVYDEEWEKTRGGR